MINNKKKSVKAQKCIYQRDNGTICHSYALKGKSYCWRHSPEISEEEKRNHFIRGGKARWQNENVKLPPVEISDINDIVKLLCDTLNRLRDGSISLKMASSTAYVTMTLILAMKESASEKERRRIEELKTIGLWPEPVISPKKYIYKDKFFMDAEGKKYVMIDTPSFFNRLIPETEETETEETETEDDEPQTEFENDDYDSGQF